MILANSRSAHGYAVNETLRFGIVGCGGRGAAFLGDKGQYCALQNHGRIVAMCDVNKERAAAGFKKINFQRYMFGTIAIHWGEK